MSHLNYLQDEIKNKTSMHVNSLGAWMEKEVQHEFQAPVSINSFSLFYFTYGRPPDGAQKMK